MELCQSLHAIYPLSPGCLLKLNEEILEPLTFRSTALLIVGRMFWFNFINWEKVKANLPYEKQLWRCWLELLCSEKVLLSLSVRVQESSHNLLHEVFIRNAKHRPHGGKLFGLKVTIIQTEEFHVYSAPINNYSLSWSCLGDVLPPVFMWQLHAE